MGRDLSENTQEPTSTEAQPVYLSDKRLTDNTVSTPVSSQVVIVDQICTYRKRRRKQFTSIASIWCRALHILIPIMGHQSSLVRLRTKPSGFSNAIDRNLTEGLPRFTAAHPLLAPYHAVVFRKFASSSACFTSIRGYLGGVGEPICRTKKPGRSIRAGKVNQSQ